MNSERAANLLDIQEKYIAHSKRRDTFSHVLNSYIFGHEHVI